MVLLWWNQATHGRIKITLLCSLINVTKSLFANIYGCLCVYVSSSHDLFDHYGYFIIQDNQWMYVIDVATCSTQIFQETFDLKSFEDVDTVIGEIHDDSSLSDEELGKIVYDSISKISSLSSSRSIVDIFKTFGSDVGVSDYDIISCSTNVLNLEVYLDIDPKDMCANILSLP